MPPALLRLMLLQFRGLLRRTTRGARAPRLVALIIVGGLLLMVRLGPSVFLSGHFPPRDPRRVRLAAPFALLGICALTLITSAGDRAISFTPGEVDLLFPGPFTRRQLIVYKLSKSTAGAALSAFFLAIVLHRQAPWWPACFGGGFLSLLLVQFFSINAVIGLQTLGSGLRARLRWSILIAFLAAVVIIARHVFAGQTPTSGFDLMRRIDAAPLAHAMLSPFSVFGDLIAATTVAEFFRFAIPAVAIDALLLALLLRLDANYLETATIASARRYSQLQRIRGGSMLSIGVGANAHWHIPVFPRLGGVGPIIWRQITGAARSSKGLLFLLLILAVGSTPLFYSVGPRTRQFATTFATVAVWLTLLVSTMLKFDFRGDLDLMDTLKSLPIHPWAVAAGQLIAPSLLMAITHLALLAIAAKLSPGHTPVFICAAILVVPMDLLLFSIENLIFLLFPSRPAAASPGDFQILGRQALVLTGKMITLTVFFTPPITAAAVTYYLLTAKSLPAFTAVAGILVCVEVLALIPVLGWAFRRFDPSIHTPA
jgi:hypothetical protein